MISVRASDTVVRRASGDSEQKVRLPNAQAEGETVKKDLHSSRRSFRFVDAKDMSQVLLVGQVDVTESDEGVVTRTTRYSTPSGANAAQESSRYQRKGLIYQKYLYEDDIHGEKIQVTFDQEAVKAGRVSEKADITYRDMTPAKTKKARITWGERALIGHGLPDYIDRYWQALKSGKTQTFAFFIPFRLETLDFRLRVEQKLASKSTPIYRLRLEASNWIVRNAASLMAPPLDFYIQGEETPMLVGYQGPSNVILNGQKNRLIRIVFDDIGPLTSYR